VGGVSRRNDVFYIEYVYSHFSKQLVILSNIDENSNPWQVGTSSIYILIFSKTRRSSLRTVGGVSWTYDVPYIEYALPFLKNDYVQQPVILSNIDEN
jgi:hypothetical protein